MGRNSSNKTTNSFPKKIKFSYIELGDLIYRLHRYGGMSLQNIAIKGDLTLEQVRELNLDATLRRANEE